MTYKNYKSISKFFYDNESKGYPVYVVQLVCSIASFRHDIDENQSMDDKILYKISAELWSLVAHPSCWGMTCFLVMGRPLALTIASI